MNIGHFFPKKGRSDRTAPFPRGSRLLATAETIGRALTRLPSVGHRASLMRSYPATIASAMRLAAAPRSLTSRGPSAREYRGTRAGGGVWQVRQHALGTLRDPARCCCSSDHRWRRRSTSSHVRRGLEGDGGAAACVDTTALIASYLSDAQTSQVRTFAATLLERNTHMNLTGAATVDEVLSRHVADSLALIPAIEAALPASVGLTDRPTPVRILDVGSGAGFPGIALAIARPEWEVTLLDTLQKRISFLESAAVECGAGNVKTLWSRAEDAGKKGSEHRESFDIVTARAVAELRILAELCIPLVSVGGAFVAMKNSVASTTEEVAAAAAVEILGGTPLVMVEVESVGPDGRLRTAAVSRKEQATPAKYPRRAGMPNKRPL